MSNDQIIKRNLGVMRQKLQNANHTTAMGCAAIATSADMLSGGQLTKAQFSHIVNNPDQCRLIKLNLVRDLIKLIGEDAIPKIRAAANPFSGLAKAGFVAEASADAAGDGVEALGKLSSNLPDVPAFKTAAVLNAFAVGVQIKTMWDIQAIEESFAHSPREFEKLFADWRSMNIENFYRAPK